LRGGCLWRRLHTYARKELLDMTSVATRGNTIAMADGTQIYYKDWGSGQAVVFSHGWPLMADMWDATMLFLASNGYRCIAHDRRGHGRSTQPWNGNGTATT
jgi:non-heme chloroperoxidase